MVGVIYLTMVRVGNIFTLRRGNATEISERNNSYGDESVRLISATGYNNGGDKFVVPKDDETIYENVLAIGNNGSVGLGKAFYHPYKFIATSDVTIMLPRDKHQLTINQGLYMKTAIEKQKRQFAYGFKLSNKRLANLWINVPTLSDTDNINWEQMNIKINEIFKNIPVINQSNHDNLNSSFSLNEREWRKFSISSIFGTPMSGKDYPQYLRVHGELPFIGSSSKNNGIVDSIAPNQFTPNKIVQDVISVNRNGSVGCSFYHPYKAYFSGDTRYLKLPKKNKYVALFLTTVISQQKSQFGYGFKLGTKRLSSMLINLPVNKEGLPDWKFMEDYIKSLPYGDIV